MIKSDKERGSTQRMIPILQQLKKRVEGLVSAWEIDDPGVVNFIQEQIDQKTRELNEYNQKKVQDFEHAEFLNELANIGQIMIDARIAAGLTQAELARQTDVKPTQISRYENSNYENATTSTLQRLAEHLHAEIDSRGIRRASNALQKQNAGLNKERERDTVTGD